MEIPDRRLQAEMEASACVRVQVLTNRRAKRLTTILAEWEQWSAEMLETHLSYPLLAFYCSQHENQLWVAAADGRLSPDEHPRLRDLIKTAGVGSSAGKHGEGGVVGKGERVEGQLTRLKELRALYESYIEGLAE